MRSMTGYGRGVAEHGELRVTVEIRAVNHRFLDIKLRGAPVGAAIEDAVAVRVRNAIERGAITVSIGVAAPFARTSASADDQAHAPESDDRSRASAVDARTHGIDVAAADRAHRVLAELAARLAVPGPDLALVLAQPGVVAAADRLDDDRAVAGVRAALDRALVQLDGMRTAEGAALAAELRGRLDEIAALRAQIAALAAAIPRDLARRLRERIQRLVDDAVDPARIAQEVALLADRADVTEELVRLTSHLDQAGTLLGGAGAVGRRLDFLVQEIGRELNTIGAKSASAEVTTAVIAAKATLEKIREQVQNIE
jgi:uncharacterized protein (TIGR00255 family)